MKRQTAICIFRGVEGEVLRNVIFPSRLRLSVVLWKYFYKLSDNMIRMGRPLGIKTRQLEIIRWWNFLCFGEDFFLVVMTFYTRKEKLWMLLHTLETRNDSCKVSCDSFYLFGKIENSSVIKFLFVCRQARLSTMFLLSRKFPLFSALPSPCVMSLSPWLSARCVSWHQQWVKVKIESLRRQHKLCAQSDRWCQLIASRVALVMD